MYEALLALDRDEDRGLAQAKAVADLPNAAEDVHVRLLHVFTDNDSGASVNQVASVREVQEYLREEDIDVTLIEESGDPAKQILDTARESDVDVIVLAGRKRSPAGKALFGSVTQRVILDSDRPVLVASTADL